MANSGASAPVLTNVTFSANEASRGGGLRNDSHSDATLSRVAFSAKAIRCSVPDSASSNTRKCRSSVAVE